MVLYAILRHQPQRHGIMQSEATYQQTGRKYHDEATAPTSGQIAAHMAGEITIAAPAAANGLAGCIVIDIDSHSIQMIPAIIQTATERGIFAWGEIHEARDRGYVWMPYDRLTNAEGLRQLGDEIIAAAIADQRGWGALTKLDNPDIDNRTANNAITRLPFAKHTWTGQRGEIIVPDGRSAYIDENPAAAFELLIENYRENPADAVPEPRTTAPESRTIAQSHNRTYDTTIQTNAEARAAYNRAVDVCDVLTRKGGRRHSRTSWHCPLPNHKNGDKSPSLLITPSKRPERYGEHIIMCYSPGCMFHAAGGEVWDAFNVEMVLEGRTYTEQIAHARQFLGLPERTKTPKSDKNHDNNTNSNGSRHHEPRRAKKPHQPGPKSEDKTTAAKIREASILSAGMDSALKQSDRKVLIALLDIAAEKIWCRPSVKTIAERAGLHPRTIPVSTKRLQTAGYISIKYAANRHGGDETNIYTIRGGLIKRSPELKESSNTKPTPVQACKGGGESPPAPAHAPDPAPMTPPPAPAHAQYIQVIPRPRRQIRTLEDLADYRPPVAPAPAHQAEAPAPAHQAEPPAAATRPISHAEPEADEPQEHYDPATGATWYEGGAMVLQFSYVSFAPPPEPEEWNYSRSPREIKNSHDFGMRQLRAAAEARENARQAAKKAPPESAPVAHQEAIQLAPSAATQQTDEQADRDELAIMRDVVKRLRDAAISAKDNGHAWQIYHRERKRLQQLETRLMGRKQAAAEAQQIPKKRRKRSAGKHQQQGLGLGL